MVRWTIPVMITVGLMVLTLYAGTVALASLFSGSMGASADAEVGGVDAYAAVD